MNDIQSVRVTATGDTTINRGRIVGLNVLTDGVGVARLTFRNTSVSGTIKLDLDFEMAADSNQIQVPQSGILFSDLVWISAMTNITAVTIFYVG